MQRQSRVQMCSKKLPQKQQGIADGRGDWRRDIGGRERREVMPYPSSQLHSLHSLINGDFHSTSADQGKRVRRLGNEYEIDKDLVRIKLFWLLEVSNSLLILEVYSSCPSD